MGGGKGPALPLSPSLSTPAVRQDRGRCRYGSIAKSERAWLVGVFIFADNTWLFQLMNIPSSRKLCPLCVGITHPVAGIALGNFDFAKFLCRARQQCCHGCWQGLGKQGTSSRQAQTRNIAAPRGLATARAMPSHRAAALHPCFPFSGHPQNPRAGPCHLPTGQGGTKPIPLYCPWGGDAAGPVSDGYVLASGPNSPEKELLGAWEQMATEPFPHRLHRHRSWPSCQLPPRAETQPTCYPCHCPRSGGHGWARCSIPGRPSICSPAPPGHRAVQPHPQLRAAA